MKKKLLAVVLCAVMAVPFVGCGSEETSETKKKLKKLKLPRIRRMICLRLH